MFCPRAGLSLQTQAWMLPFCTKAGTKVVVLLGMIRYCSFPLLSALHSFFSIWKDLKRCEKIRLEVRRVDLANWALRTSPRFATGVKYQIYQDFWPEQRSGNPNHPSPPQFPNRQLIRTSKSCLTLVRKEDLSIFFNASILAKSSSIIVIVFIKTSFTSKSLLAFSRPM